MEKLNMANMNTLIRKGYLLAGVIMAANMFVVNEMKAMEIKDDNKEINDKTNPSINNDKNTEQKKDIRTFFPLGPCKYIGFLLQWENTINLVGGALFTLTNSFYKFYENKPGFYFDYYFTGWNSNPFAKGYLQFCPNINLGRGIFWLIMLYSQNFLRQHYRDNIIKDLEKRGVDTSAANNLADQYLFFFFGEYTPGIIALKLIENINGDKKRNKLGDFFSLLLRLLQNFVSVPLIIHLTSEFTISIAFDAIMWMVVTHFVASYGGFKGAVENLKENLINIFSYAEMVSFLK